MLRFSRSGHLAASPARRCGLAVVAALLLQAVPAAAAVYRWVDAAGVVHYSESPPDHGNYDRLNISTGSSGVHVGVDDLSGKPAASTTAEGGIAAKAQDAERCAKARERIQVLEQTTAHRLMVTGADGQPARMTDEQYNAALSDAHKAADAVCK